MCATQRPLHWKQFVVKTNKFYADYDCVTDYVISENYKTWPNSVSLVLFGLGKWFTHQNVCNQAIFPMETIWSLIKNVSHDYIIFNLKKKRKKRCHTQSHESW